jgi:hypothetical protein
VEPTQSITADLDRLAQRPHRLLLDYLDLDFDGLVCRLDGDECIPHSDLGGGQVTCAVLRAAPGGRIRVDCVNSRSGISRLSASSTAHRAASTADRDPSMPTTIVGGE